MNKNSIYISNRLSLRAPQEEALKILENILDNIELKKDFNLKDTQNKIHDMYPIFKEFEREFPSICFALATGVGKTRLMAAFMVYLYKQKGIKNFMVIAPNLTIYNKLMNDFGNPSYSKYAFKGISEFSTDNVRIVTGDNYNEQAAGQTSLYDITINIFNISKIDAKERGNSVPLIKRLSEYIGQSYFEYLSGLNDLVILMDESHHYRADRGMQVLNELKPILGLEVTATPQIEKSGRTTKFKNVVYEYSLAKAMNDGYVKIPYVATKKNFDTNAFGDKEKDLIKLQDGIKLHENTKVELDIYARDNKLQIVKPFVLVVAKDTPHAEEIYSTIQSNEFFDGEYKDKVIIVHSNQSGEEKEENIQQLLSLENPDNNIEIVIHVNMLKEGWDVKNLYTIIPLRTSASATLTEQTIGRGLRLPYGKITGNNKVDRLTIVSHDKYSAIIDEANKEGSLIKQENIIDIDDEITEDKKEVMVSKISYIRTPIQNANNNILEDVKMKYEVIGKTCEQVMNAATSLKEVEVKNINDLKAEQVKKEVIEKAITDLENDNQVMLSEIKEQIKEELQERYDEIIDRISDVIIEIPNIIIVQKESKIEYKDFDLDTRFFNYQSVDDVIVLHNLHDNTEIQENVDNYTYMEGRLEDFIVNKLIDKPEIDYDKCANLIYKLATQVINKLREKFNDDEEIKKILQYRKKEIVDFIYAQMKEHQEYVVGEYEDAKVFPFKIIEEHNNAKFKKDDILDYTTTVSANELRMKVFGGFNKACHNVYKFDSIPEKNLVACLERDSVKWMRPAPKQFNLWYDNNRKQYEPDFVVEMEDTIYLVEVKRESDLEDTTVLQKKKAAEKYCELATKYNLANGKKKWEYIIIPANMITYDKNFDEYVRIYKQSNN